MGKRIRFTWMLLIYLSLSFTMYAQQADSISEEDNYSEEEYYEYETIGMFFSFDFDVSVPIFLTRQDLKRPVYGIHTQFLYQIDKSRPVFMGIAFSIGRYDHESIEYYDFTEFEENLFRETANCDVMHIDFKTRYFPNWTIDGLEPFFDLSFGVRNSFAYTSVTNVDYDESVNTRFHDADWGLGYGLGLGALVDMEYLTGNGNVFGHFSFDFLSGENSFLYLARDDISGVDEPIERFERKSIPFQFLNIDAGIIVYF